MRNLALDIAKSDRVNPTALFLASVRMLKHMGLADASQRIERSVKRVISDGKVNASQSV